MAGRQPFTLNIALGQGPAAGCHAVWSMALTQSGYSWDQIWLLDSTGLWWAWWLCANNTGKQKKCADSLSPKEKVLKASLVFL